MTADEKPETSGSSPLPQRPHSPRRRHRRPAGQHWHRRRPSAHSLAPAGESQLAESIPAPEDNRLQPTEVSAPGNQEPEANLGLPLTVLPEPESKVETHTALPAPAAAAAPQPQAAPGFRRQGRFPSRHRHADAAYPSAPKSADPLEDLLARLDLITCLLHTEQEMTRRFTGDISTGMKGLKFPGLDPRRAKEQLVEFIRTQSDRTGKAKIIAGVSGGLDSAVSAYLLVEALGHERVQLVHYQETDKNSFIRTRAEAVARALQTKLHFEDLRPILKPIFTGHRDLSLLARKGRITRERMAAWFDLARSQNALVAGSINKTKLLLGIGIEHGDLACDFNLLGDLYQSQVLELARYLHIPGILLDRILRVQGADGQTWDQDIERSIKELDYYLYQIVDARISLAYLQKSGMDEEKLLWVYRRLRSSAFQRSLPPLAEAVSVYVPRSGEL